jgi:hypothetical protein
MSPGILQHVSGQEPVWRSSSRIRNVSGSNSIIGNCTPYIDIYCNSSVIGNAACNNAHNWEMTKWCSRIEQVYKRPCGNWHHENRQVPKFYRNLLIPLAQFSTFTVKTASSVEVVVPIYQIAWHYASEKCNFNTHFHCNLNSQKNLKYNTTLYLDSVISVKLQVMVTL